MVKITFTSDIEIPGLPNFIRVKVARKEQQKLLDIADLTNEQLGQIGTAWTEKLLEKAERRRITRKQIEQYDKDRSY